MKPKYFRKPNTNKWQWCRYYTAILERFNISTDFVLIRGVIKK